MSRPNGARLGSEAPCRPLPPDAHLKAASPALAWAQQKADDGSRRAGWRSFGEYIFLEDSRYASQRKKLPPSGFDHARLRGHGDGRRERGLAAFRFAAKRATYCADGRKRQHQAERERARDLGRAREEGVVACELDHPPRQPPARERRWR